MNQNGTECELCSNLCYQSPDSIGLNVKLTNTCPGSSTC